MTKYFAAAAALLFVTPAAFAAKPRLLQMRSMPVARHLTRVASRRWTAAKTELLH